MSNLPRSHSCCPKPALSPGPVHELEHLGCLITGDRSVQLPVEGLLEERIYILHCQMSLGIVVLISPTIRSSSFFHLGIGTGEGHSWYQEKSGHRHGVRVVPVREARSLVWWIFQYVGEKGQEAGEHWGGGRLAT